MNQINLVNEKTIEKKQLFIAQLRVLFYNLTSKVVTNRVSNIPGLKTQC